MAFSPIGEMQSVGGFMIFVNLIALKSASASWTAILEGRAFPFKPAFSQISFATLVLTLEKSLVRQERRFFDFVSCSIFINIPSSMP